MNALLRKLAGFVAATLAAIFGLAVMAWLVIHWAILPHIENWRGAVEQRATAALGVPVRIGGITVTSSGWVPAFELIDVALLGPDGQPALRLPRVVAALSPRSLLALELRFEQLLIENAQLDVQRDAQGRLRIAGLDVSAPSTAPAEDAALVTDWFFRQHELVVRGASVRWSDAQRHLENGAPPLVLSNVLFVMRNGLRQHDFRLDGTPPSDWGDRFSVSGKFTQALLARPGDWTRWSGAVHADLPRADLRELRRHVDLPLDVSQGHGAVRAWLEVRSGKLTEGVADVALRGVELRLGPQLQASNFDHLQGRLVAQRQADKQGDTLRLSAQKFSFGVQVGDGKALLWPSSDMGLTLRCAGSCQSGEAVRSGEFNAQRLDLGLLAELAQRLPLTDGLRRHLTELRPQGLVTGLSTRWEGPVDAPSTYQVKALFSGFSIAARPSPLSVANVAGAAGIAGADPTALGRPGLSGA
ncbi:MAG: AsmA family protein, partial [Pseudorhodobacter sp.]|nr:AsmA family protein [Rhizobacter sp.]